MEEKKIEMDPIQRGLAELRKIEKHIEEIYPGVFARAAEVRAKKRGEIPDHLYLTKSMWERVIGRYLCADCGRPLKAHEMNVHKGAGVETWITYPDHTLIDMHAAWRQTKGMYRFDRDLARELVATPETTIPPASYFRMMPEWGVYVDLSGLDVSMREYTTEGAPLGFLASLSGDGKCDYLKLSVLSESVWEDGGSGVRICSDIIELPETREQETTMSRRAASRLWGVESAEVKKRISAISAESGRPEIEEYEKYVSTAEEKAYRQVREGVRTTCACLSMLMYICSAGVDMAGETGASERPEIPMYARRSAKKDISKTARGAVGHRRWDIGYRIGAALRKAAERRLSGQPDPNAEGTGTKKCTHKRDAHWCKYWYGPRKGGDKSKQKAMYRWIPPLIINADLSDELLPVLRKVSGDAKSALENRSA